MGIECCRRDQWHGLMPTWWNTSQCLGRAGICGSRLARPDGCTQRCKAVQGSTPQMMLIRQWLNEIEGVAAVPRVTGRSGWASIGERHVRFADSGLKMRRQPAGVDRITSWSQLLVEGLIKRAVMEGILRQAPRLSGPPAAEAGLLEVGWPGWDSCGCSAGPRIQAGST